jgi:hypothetical protein
MRGVGESWGIAVLWSLIGGLVYAWWVRVS